MAQSKRVFSWISLCKTATDKILRSGGVNTFFMNNFTREAKRFVITSLLNDKLYVFYNESIYIFHWKRSGLKTFCKSWYSTFLKFNMVVLDALQDWMKLNLSIWCNGYLAHSLTSWFVCLVRWDNFILYSQMVQDL